MNANLAFTLRRADSIGLFYAGLDTPAATNPISHLETPQEQTSVLSFGYSIPVRHVFLFANAFESFSGGGSPGVQFGATVPLGRRTSVEASSGTEGAVGGPGAAVGDVGGRLGLSGVLCDGSPGGGGSRSREWDFERRHDA